MNSDLPNVLAERYASHSMKSVWSARGKIIMEREFWIAVMKAQKVTLNTITKDININSDEQIKILTN